MLIFAVVIIAASSIVVAATFYWLAKTLVSSAVSLKELLETVNRDVMSTVTMLQSAIKDVGDITEKVSEQTGKLDGIVENARQVSEDVKSTTGMINRTVVPTLGNLHAVSAGFRKALETWNEYEGKKEEDK